MMIEKQFCPICASDSFALDVVDFNKSCGEVWGFYLPLSGIPIYYFLCSQCNFCFAPEIYCWKIEEFEQKIYNSDYIKVDPDYRYKRPYNNSQLVMTLLNSQTNNIKHLDYGGGKVH